MTSDRQDVDEPDAVDLGRLPDSLGFLLRIAQLDAYERFAGLRQGLDLRPGELTLLCVIAWNPGQRQGTFAEALKIKPAHMTKLVQRMVKSGLVTRRVPDDDRRSVRLFLTDRAEQMVEDACDRVIQLHRDGTPLTREEFDTLVTLLRKLTGVPAP